MLTSAGQKGRMINQLNPNGMAYKTACIMNAPAWDVLAAAKFLF
jgi:hypothetical protein